MEIVVLLILIGALWLGFKLGANSGRDSLLNAQSQSIGEALTGCNDFYQRHGLHGCYLLVGHEHRSPTDFVIVKYSDLERALNQRITSSEAPDSADAALPEDALNYQVRAQAEAKWLPSPALANIVGQAAVTKTEATKLVWKYIEKEGLHDSANQQIECDAQLQLITGLVTCTPFQLTKKVSDQLSQAHTKNATS